MTEEKMNLATDMFNEIDRTKDIIYELENMLLRYVLDDEYFCITIRPLQDSETLTFTVEKDDVKKIVQSQEEKLETLKKNFEEL